MKKNKKNGQIGGYLFGAIFFLAGAGFFYGLVATKLLDAWDMQSWYSVKAELVSAKIDSYRKRNDNGGYTTMYKVVASYRYQINGQSYLGKRPSVDTGSSSERDDHYALLSRLKQEQARNGQIGIWYDPANPSESVYDRSLNWRMIIMISAFCSVFMLIGGGIMGYIFVSRKDDLPPQNADPDKPWTTRENWASAVVYSRAAGNVKVAWFLVALSICFFGTFAVAMFGRHPIATGFSVLLMLVPLLAVKRAIRIQREWKRYEKVPIRLDPYPGVIGGPVGGQMIIPARMQSGDSYRLSLECIKHWTSRSGGKTRSHQGVIWSEEQVVTPKNQIDGSGVKFRFRVPAGQPESSPPEDTYHEWVLSVKGDIQGQPFDREYELPVFITEASQTVSEELAETPLSTTQQREIEDRLEMKRVGETLSLNTPGSNVGLFFALIGGLFTVIGIVIAVIEAPVFGTFFALIGSLFFALGLWVWGKNSKVRVSPSGCEVDVFWFGRAVKQHRLLPADIKSIEINRSSSSQSGKKIEEKFGLKLVTHQAGRIDIGGEFKSRRNAEHMKQEFERVLLRR